MPVTWPAAPPVRLMGDLGLRGVRRAKSARTTRSAPREQCPADLVKRHFSAFRPNELWVADIPPQAGGTPSYVRTFSGWVYVAFVTDVYSRRIIGWQTTYRPVCTDLALDALEMAVWQRKRAGADLTGLVHHLRPRRAVQVHSLRGCPVRLRGSRLGGVKGDSFRLCPGRGAQAPCTRPSSSATKDPGRTSTPPAVATAEQVHWYGHHPATLRRRHANPRRARRRLGTRHPPPRTTTNSHHRHQTNQPPQNPRLDTRPSSPWPTAA